MAQKWVHVETDARTLQVGPGRLAGVIISHAYRTPHYVLVYDGVSVTGGTLLAKFYVHPENCPVQMYFVPEWAFAKGLVVVPGFCQVQVIFGG